MFETNDRIFFGVSHSQHLSKGCDIENITGIFSIAVKITKDKERLKNCTRLRGLKKQGNLSSSGSWTRKEKCTHWDNWHNLMVVYKLDGGVQFSSLSGYIMVAPVYVVEHPCFTDKEIWMLEIVSTSCSPVKMIGWWSKQGKMLTNEKSEWIKIWGFLFFVLFLQLLYMCEIILK